MNAVFMPVIFLQGYIFCKILRLGGVGKKWCRGKKLKNEAVRKKKEKGERKKVKGKGESDFFVNIWHTFVDYCPLFTNPVDWLKALSNGVSSF